MHPHCMQSSLLRLNGQDSSQPYGQLTSSTLELRAHLNRTKSNQKEVTTPGKHVLCLSIHDHCYDNVRPLEHH